MLSSCRAASLLAVDSAALQGADGWVAAVKGKAPRGRSVVLLLRAWLPCLVLFKLRSRPTALQGKRWR